MKKNGCSIIYGGTKEERDQFASDFLSKNPEYALQIRKELLQVKKGLFAKKLTTNDVLMKDNEVKMRGISFLKNQMARLRLDMFLDRYPTALTMGPKLMYSLFLDVLNGRMTFFLRDDSFGEMQQTAKCIFWIYDVAGANMDDVNVIWLTEEKMEAFLEPIYQDERESSFPNLSRSWEQMTIWNAGNHFYELNAGKTEEKKAEKLAADIRAEREHRIAEEYETAERLKELKFYKEAVAVYTQLLLKNEPKAMTEAARLYLEHFENKAWIAKRLLENAWKQHQYEEAHTMLLQLKGEEK